MYMYNLSKQRTIYTTYSNSRKKNKERLFNANQT